MSVFGVIHIRSSDPLFPAFGLNTDQNNSEYGHFLRSDCFMVVKPFHITYVTQLWPNDAEALPISVNFLHLVLDNFCKKNVKLAFTFTFL